MDKVKLTIDGKEVTARANQTILEVIQENHHRRDPHPVPRAEAPALRFLLPVRGGGRRGQKADPVLLQPGGGQDGRPHRQPAHP